MSGLAFLANKLLHKYSSTPDDLGTTRPEGFMRATLPEGQGERIKMTLEKAWKPFRDYVADSFIDEDDSNFLIDIDFMNVPNRNWGSLPELSHDHFFHTLLEFIKTLQRAFPEGKVSLHQSNFRGPKLVKLIKVIIPREPSKG